MVSITFIDGEGREHRIEAEPGCSVMEAAVNNDIPGIIGECGGYCACGTCVAWIDAAWREKTGEPNDAEGEMLEFLETQEPGARLTCQIRVTEEIDGLVVRTPSQVRSAA